MQHQALSCPKLVLPLVDLQYCNTTMIADLMRSTSWILREAMQVPCLAVSRRVLKIGRYQDTERHRIGRGWPAVDVLHTHLDRRTIIISSQFHLWLGSGSLG
ncbi:hypothetical protein H0G86_012269 [Trichoderma simmonsii]|uniref:Uncharacterized protein n=1 Tax=Trichoderma simmonsii TaxID=1491479 RepID=A0A8G0PK37_9HYPO|nr:hypothetical protein H0G86_012269 [Trichoderma simmonsii]